MGLSHFVRRIWRHPSNRGRRLRALLGAAAWELRGRPSVDRTMFGGLRIRCHADSGVAMGLVYYSGRPEYHEMGLVAHLLRPGDRFLDVGANAGYYSLLAASCVGPKGNVEAFEPGHPAVERLRENIALNGLTNVRVHELALGRSAGEARFVGDRDTENRLATAADKDVSTVTVARLDDVLGGAACAMGKIDIEGAELLALQGAESLLAAANPPVWLIEVGKRLRAFGTTEEELAAWLGGKGFDVGLYDTDTREFRFGGAPWKERPNVVAVARVARERVERLVRQS